VRDTVEVLTPVVTGITYSSEKWIEYRRGWKQQQERSMNIRSKFSLRDRLTMTTTEGKIELKEEELSRATGGLAVRKAGKTPIEFLKIKLNDVLVSG